MWQVIKCMFITCTYFLSHSRYAESNAGEPIYQTYKQHCFMTHATVTHIPQVKGSAGNRRITVSSRVNRVNFHLTSSKAYGYCILQIAYSGVVMWSRREKRVGFCWLKKKKWNTRSAAFTVAQLLLFQSVDVCGAPLDMAWPERVALLKLEATCELHTTRSCADLWPPVLLNSNQNKERGELQRRVCFVRSHGGLTLGCFLSYPPAMPRWPPTGGWCHSEVIVKYKRWLS